MNTAGLPGHFSRLNADDAHVFVSAYEHLGGACEKTIGNKLLFIAESVDVYNILALATRIDPDAVTEFAKLEVERFDPDYRA